MRSFTTDTLYEKLKQGCKVEVKALSSRDKYIYNRVRLIEAKIRCSEFELKPKQLTLNTHVLYRYVLI